MRPELRRQRTGYRILTSISEMGLGASFARSRGRLVITTVIVTVVFAVYSMVTATWMRESSREVILNLFLISAAMLFILVVAYFQALLIGDLFFPGRWRERVILGQKIEIAEEESPEAMLKGVRDYSMPFWAIFLGLIVFSYLLHGWLTGGFMSEYQTWGYQVTLLRSEAAEDRVRGVRNLVNPRESEAQDTDEVRQALAALVHDPDEEVVSWALWGISELRVYEAMEPLLGLLSDEGATDTLRGRAAESLGFLASREGARRMAEELIASMGRDPYAIGLLRGLGLARVEETASFIEPMLTVEPAVIRAHAYWAMGRTGNREYRDRLFRTVEEGSDEDRCFAAEALKFLATRDDLIDAHSLFASAPDLHCEGIEWRMPYHWDDDGSFHMDIIVDESLAEKCLKVIFTSGGASQRDFFASIANDPERPEQLRMLARELALRIDHRQ